jgi:RNA polymerase II subunit A C-terminal domain phosphatase SSU72
MYKDLSNKDLTLYTQNGILHMLDRNRRIKLTPERFQDCKDQFDVIFTVEERVFDQVIEGIYLVDVLIFRFEPIPDLDLENRQKESNQPVHIINIDVADNHEDATLGAYILVELAQLVFYY